MLSAQRPIKLRYGPEEAGSEFDVDSEAGNEATLDGAQSSGGSESETAGAGNDTIDDISFGALAQAQASLAPRSRKRKVTDLQNGSNEFVGAESPEQNPNTDARASKSSQSRISRSSKHAPAIESSRKPVSRRRTVFSPPPVTKFRDPRFDPSIIADASRRNATAPEQASRNYSFLTDYQAAEVLDLKSQLKKSKDLDAQAQLKRQIMSLEAKLRNAEVRKRESEILRNHKQQEKAAIREGKKAKPYYLKKSDVKKQIETDRLENMGKRARDKSERRKRKREKTKQARDMPRARRAIDD